jgi:DNA-binding transcriptional LysR family regulator
VKIGGRFRADDSDALLQAARDGLGIGLLPTWILYDDLRSGRLTPLMTDRRWSIAPGQDPAIYGVYPPKKTVSPKVRAFLEFMANRIGSPPYWEAYD